MLVCDRCGETTCYHQYDEDYVTQPVEAYQADMSVIRLTFLLLVLAGVAILWVVI